MNEDGDLAVIIIIYKLKLIEQQFKERAKRLNINLFSLKNLGYVIWFHEHHKE